MVKGGLRWTILQFYSSSLLDTVEDISFFVPPKHKRGLRKESFFYWNFNVFKVRKKFYKNAKKFLHLYIYGGIILNIEKVIQ